VIERAPASLKDISFGAAREKTSPLSEWRKAKRLAIIKHATNPRAYIGSTDCSDAGTIRGYAA
jgi:hypothetical protein